MRLKKDRLAGLQALPEAPARFRFELLDLADGGGMAELFRRERFSHVVNLAAQAGVRYSLQNPASYVNSNLAGFGNLLEGCRHNGVEHLLFASSSSVYGLNAARPYSVHHNVDHPVSLYAATKKSNELMAHAYSHLYRLPCTGLRFFTVYGPWGRPDMALHLFTTPLCGAKPSRSSTRAACAATSPISTTSWKAWSACCPDSRARPGLRRRRARPGLQFRALAHL